MRSLVVSQADPDEVGPADLSGVFMVGSIAWGVVFDGFRPDRYDLGGAALCLVGSG